MTSTRLLRTIMLACVALGTGAVPASALNVTWMQGFASPGTPAKYNEVGVIKVGRPSAKNVLVLEPGTSAGGAYFVPLAKWIVSAAPGWQVWSVERRENLLEDQAELNAAKAGRVTPMQAFDYYLGYLADPSITVHFHSIPDSSVAFAKQWGMNVAVHDVHRVIRAASKLGGKVVLGGHSLGGAVVTAYATWNFAGRPGARGLAGLVYIDGGSFAAVSRATAIQGLETLKAPGTTPWFAFGGIPAPFAGLFDATGSLGSLLDPNSPSLGQTFSLLPADLKPPVRVTNLAQYGYALNVGTSPPTLVAGQAHLGRGIAAPGAVHGWDGTGALTPIKRFATMFSGLGMNVDGTEWYFPTRLFEDAGAVGNGLPNPAQSVVGVHSTLGRELPKTLRIYAFAAALGRSGVLLHAHLLAKQSHIPTRNLTLINRQGTYAHNDPAGAFPHNVFFQHLIPFLRRIAALP